MSNLIKKQRQITVVERLESSDAVAGENDPLDGYGYRGLCWYYCKYWTLSIRII